MITFITGVFSGSWSQAWEGIKQIFGSAFDGLVALCKAPLNAVIAIINKAISGINGLGLTIPEWVPILGGKSFSVNIPTLPMLARGGFTDGVSIAGEAGTEAVISFQRGVRSDNINTWTQAGRMLGVSGEQAAVAAGVPYADGGGAVELATLEATQGNNAVELQEIDTGKPQPEQDGGGTPDGGGQVVFAPQITVQGNRRATSVYDASVQLCAEINNANHGRVKLKFSVMGNWGVSAGNNLRLTGYGDGLNGGINGKYFVDKVTHKYTKSGGFVTSFECSGIFDPFHYWDVGGHIEYHQSEDSSSESYNSAYETTSPAANAASAAAGATAGAAVTLTKAPFYYTSVAPKPSCYKSGTFYFYDGILVNNRYRITNTAARCGKLPVGKNVTGWVPASYCNGGGITTK